MALFETKGTDYALFEMRESGLFSEKELDIARTWLIETPVITKRSETHTIAHTIVGMSPNKAAKLLPVSTEYLRLRVADGRLDGGKYDLGWLIDYKAIIELKREKGGK